MTQDLKAKTAISGVGMTEMGKVYGHNTGWFAAEAIRLALEDAGLKKEDLDGLLVNQGVTPLPGMGGLDLQNHLGLTNLRLLASMQAGGATAAMMVQYAAAAGRASSFNPTSTASSTATSAPLKPCNRNASASPSASTATYDHGSS